MTAHDDGESVGRVEPCRQWFRGSVAFGYDDVYVDTSIRHLRHVHVIVSAASGCLEAAHPVTSFDHLSWYGGARDDVDGTVVAGVSCRRWDVVLCRYPFRNRV